MTNIPDVGPLPIGTYTIGQPYNDSEVGIFALPLTPDPSNEMFGRSKFRIHGDNPKENQSASKGCIVAPRFVRNLIAESKDKTLVVRG